MERYVYVLNADKYANENIDYTFDNKHVAFTENKAFKNTSVNPVIKCTNINEEHNGTSANFFEIRNTYYNGKISNDNTSAIVNRIYPSTNTTNLVTDATYAQNRQQTASYKIRTYSTKSATNSASHANQLLVGNSSLNIDLDTNDYFVLINPQIVHSASDKTPSLRPHFAKITKIVSFDEHGDGFQFEPKYPESIPRYTNFEIYKGPLVSDTSVVALSYGLRGDGSELGTSTTDDYDQTTPVSFITDKYDASNEVSRPIWYFYNDRLTNKNQLDYNTKYNLTTCRCFDWTSKGSIYNLAADTAYASATIDWTPGSNTLKKGQSIYKADKTYLGNVTGTTSTTITLDYARQTISGITALNSETAYVGRTIHQSVFRTEREYGTIIIDYGTLNQDAILVDKMYNKDGEIGSTDSPTDYEASSTYTFDPSNWKDAFRNCRRQASDYNSSHSSYTTSNTESVRHANLTGPNRCLYYKKSHKKNNSINPIMEITVNNPKNKISQFATTKLLDNNGIQFIKIKEDETYTISNATHTSNTSDVKLPYTATSSYSASSGGIYYIHLNNINETAHADITDDSTDNIVELDWKPTIDYGVNQIIKAGTILKVEDVYYRVGTIATTDEATRKQEIRVTAKKKANDKTWTILAQESHLPIFTDSDIYIVFWTDGINTSCPIDTEAIYESNTLQRLTVNEKTISKLENSLYKRRLVLLNREFYGYEIEIDYGDKNHKHLKLLTTKTLYQPDSTKKHFMYYYQGGYCIEDDVFNGTVEDIDSENKDGILTYTINGRDNTGVLLNNTTNKNLHKTDDIVYSSIAPIFDIPATTVSRHSMTNTGTLTLTGTVTVNKYDLFINSNKELIGEAISSAASGSNTAVTLGGFDYTRGTAGTSTLYHIKTFGDLENYLTGTKALSTNIKLTTHPTDFSSLGHNGLIFNDGQKIEYSSSFSFSDLLNTSATGSYSYDNTVGYDISDIKSIEEDKDSSFALKLAEETRASINYKPTQTVSSMHFNVLDIDSSNKENSILKIAPSFPVVLGSIDTNTSDVNGYGTDMRYLYMVNSNIPSGGFIHELPYNPRVQQSSFYSPRNTFRYWGLQKFKEGTIKESHDSVYNNSNKTQRITGAAPMYKINSMGEKINNPTYSTSGTIDLTPNLYPHSPYVDGNLKPLLKGSNFWTGTDMGLTDRDEPIEYWNGSVKTVTWKQLENIDYRAKNYNLFAIGDIYPDSKLRWNNLQFNTKDFNNYGMVLKTKGREGDLVSHENFTGTNTQTDESDSNYERIEITSSNKTTNQLKRFGVVRLVEATFDWHMNPIDYESAGRNEDYDKLSKFKYPRMKILYNALVDTYSAGNSVSFDTITDSSGSSVANMTLLASDIIYRADGTVLGEVHTGVTNVTSLSISGTEIVLYGDAPVSNEKVYIIRQKIFTPIADPDWGIDSLNHNEMKMLNTYIMVPDIQRDYFSFNLLTSATLSKKFDAQNIFIPLISENIHDGSGSTMSDYYSLFHQAKHWDSATTDPIWYHPSKVINALAYPTTRDDSPGTDLIEDGLQYKINNKADLYGESHILFKDMRKSFKQGENQFELPTSALLSPGNYGDYDDWEDYVDDYGLSDPLDQRAVNVTMVNDENGSYSRYWSVCGMKTEKHIYSADGNRSWDRELTHSSTGNDAGGGFQAQAFIKPRIRVADAYNSSILTYTMNTDGHNWLNFVPNLTGYYLVSDKITDKLNNTKYLPSKYNTTSQATTGTPIYIGKIYEHSTTVSGNYRQHTLKLDKTITQTSHGNNFRLMRISETTFEDTPDYFEINEMFDTGLQYDSLKQNYITGEKEDSLSETDMGGATETDDSTAGILAYQEGLYSMYLLLDIDNFNTYIDRRVISDIHASFADGDSLNCYITDGKNSIEKNIILSRKTTPRNTLRFSYDGKLTGYGVISFGETFTIESTSTPDSTEATEAFIGTTFSIGTDVENAIVDILEENNIEVDSSLKNMTYTGNIVDSDTSGTTITFTTNHSKIKVNDIIYTQDGRLIGKVTTANAGATIAVSNIFYKPKKNDEITKYERHPFILNTNFNEQDIFSSVNYLAAKRQLDYSFKDDKIKINDLSNYHSKRQFSLKYRDGANLISVKSNKSLFDKANKIVVIGDNVKAEVEIPSKKTRTIKHIDSNIKNIEEARIKANALLELHRKGYRKITLEIEKTGFELMKAGDIIHLDFPNHNIPADDYIVFEIENIMTKVTTITVGTFNKTIAERLTEISLQQNTGFTNLLTKKINKTLTGKALIDNILPKEKTLHYELTSSTGGTIIGFN